MKEILISEIELTESDVIIFYLTPFVTSDKKVHRFCRLHGLRPFGCNS